MSMIGKPDWEKIRQIKDLDDLKSFKVDDLAFASVKFEFPPETKFPCLPERTLHGLVFPLKGTSICGIPEIKLALKLNATLEFRDGVYVPTNKDVRIFEEFIVYCITQRQHFKKTMEKGNLYEQFWKEMGNSTYGKTAQGLRERRVYDLKEMKAKTLEESDITNPFFASFITSFVRGTLGEILNKLLKTVCVFSVTTDGFLTNATDKQMEQAQTGELCSRMREGRKVLDADDEILEVKHKVRQPLGWRTRGQATLKPYSDWDKTDDGYNKDSNYVLAKGGITLNRNFEKWEQNSEIVKWFLERKPNHAIRFETLVGMKDTWELENDVVPQPNERVLSMEFDWKRKPTYVTDKTVKFEGESYTHVYWETGPWGSIDDFLKVRDAMEQYNHGKDTQRHCLKTLSDYNEFREYLESQISLPEKERSWMRKSGGSHQRLRMSVLSGWRRGRCGFVIDESRKRRKPSHDDWVQIFEKYGIQCSIKDVENSKRRDFKPHTVPNTDETNEILESMKKEYFPTLDIEEILSHDRGIDIQPQTKSQYRVGKGVGV